MQKSIIIKYAQIISALGTLEQTTEALIQKKSGIIAGPCFGVDVTYAPFQDVKLHSTENICKKLAVPQEVTNKNLLFIFAAAKGDLSYLENFYKQNQNGKISQSLLDLQLTKIITFLNIHPTRSIVISTACASGASAVDYARECMLSGQYSDVIIFGFDIISEFIAKGFHSLGALSPQRARPFDSARNGLTLGDGAAIMWLTYNNAKTGDICIRGTGTSNDANHRTGPSRTGDGLFRAIQSAFEDASLTAQSIGAIKCHGTATNYNDAMEAKAIYSCFGKNIPPCVSFKGALGHTSGAGSLMEIILAATFLKKRCLPPTMGFESIGVDEPVAISSEVQSIDAKPILCLSAGFGGLNAAVIIEESCI